MKNIIKSVVSTPLKRNFTKTPKLLKDNEDGFQNVDDFSLRAKKLTPFEYNIDDENAIKNEKLFFDTLSRTESNFEEDYPAIGKATHYHLGKNDVVFDRLRHFKEFTAPIVTKKDIEDLLNEPLEQDNFLLIDLRSPFKASDYKIPKSINIPLADIGCNCLDISPKDFMQRYKLKKPFYMTNLIFFSDDANDGEVASICFRIRGYKNCFNFRGGVQEWFGTEFKVTKKVSQKDLYLRSDQMLGYTDDREDVVDEIDQNHEEDPLLFSSVLEGIDKDADDLDEELEGGLEEELDDDLSIRNKF